MDNGISIVMAYYNRRNLLIKTLQSINKTKYDKSKLEIIIINDNSYLEHNINDIPFMFNKLNIKILNIEKEEKNWVNSSVTYNIGFNYIKYDKVIIQNPECYHNGDILEYVNDNLLNDNYLTFACYSLGWNEIKLNNYNDIKILNQESKLACGPGWYNHSEYRPSYYHFCSAISFNNLKKINGFDEDYKNGIGWDDNEILHRIKLLKINIKIIDNPFVFHQAHESENYRYNKNSPLEEKNDKNKLFNINQNIFIEKTKKLDNYYIKNGFIKKDN